MEYHTQRNDLLSADKPCQQRRQHYLDTFGDDDDMVVVAEGNDPDKIKAALDAVAQELKARPELFDRVFHKVDLRHLRDRALLHLPIEELEATAGRIERMSPLLGPVAPIAWRKLSTQTLLGYGARALEAQHRGEELSLSDRDLLAQLPAVASCAAHTVRDPETYRDPWGLPAASHISPTDKAALELPRYFFTPDSTLAMLTCRPKKAAQSFTPAKEANAAMRAILAEVEPRFAGVTLGLTGLPVLETDEMELSDTDTTRASFLALFGVALLYFAVYRRPRYPLLTITTLIVGTLWALGWATITVGHLNILSATFAVMLIGMGDYGVLWVARYDEARKAGASVDAALRETALQAGPSIITAAATTGLAFFAVMLADFKAVAELGWIAGSGVLFCALSCILLMPPLLVMIDQRGRTTESPVPKVAAKLPTRASPSVRWYIPDYHPRWLLLCGVVLVLVFGSFATRLRYDHNLLNLQPQGLDSVVWEHKLIDRAAGASWDAMSIANSREEALTLKAKYAALAEVGHVVEVASIVPADQEKKLLIIKAIHERLAGLPSVDRLPLSAGSDPVAVRELAVRVAALAGSDTPLSQAVQSLRLSLESTPEAGERLRAFDRRLTADLAAKLNQLRAVSRPEPITLTDVPEELRERYVGVHGEFLVRAFARDSLWDYHSLERFTVAANTVDPEATGKSFRTLEGLRQMKAGFERAALYALAAIVVVLLLDLRRFTDLLLGLFPLAVGVTLTLGVMGLCSVSLNPANMIALPLIVGVGVDNGVHVLHDYRNRDPLRPYRLGSATGRGVLVAALTTILGFGTLMTARHEGMASLGLALTLGVTFCMLAALVWLPAVLHLLDRRRNERDVVAMVLGTKPTRPIPTSPLVARSAA
jgi:hopanoid biosynthesis associated RND transporter like protein HpnN